ncbi:MAG: BrnT family toxin [Pseudomonadota bacterium]
MEVEFDPDKNRKNIEVRGLPFEDVVYLDWDNAIVWSDNRENYSEERYCALAIMPSDTNLYSVVFTIRSNIIRVISFRRANTRERRKYDGQKTSKAD